MIVGLLLLGGSYLVWRERQAERASAAPPPVPQDPAVAQEQAVDRELNHSLMLLGATTLGALASPLFTIASIPFLVYQTVPLFRMAYAELTEQHKVGGAFIGALASVGILATGAFWISSVNGVLYAVSEKLQLRVQRSSRRGLSQVFGELPRTVWVRVGDVEVEVSVDSLKAGDRVVIRAGESIAVDGVIEGGVASIDQQALTGEAQPAEKGPGDTVFAATIVLSGSIDVRVERTGAATVVASIEDILERTSSYTSGLELKGKVIADRTVVPTLLASAATLPLLGQEAAVCMLAVYPGEGMRMLGPLSLLNFLRRAAAERILVKDGRAFESLEDVDTVVFDKTGTLTDKVPSVVRIHAEGTHTEEAVLAVAAAAEVRQTHPVALAIQDEARIRLLRLPAVEEASYEIGLGISVVIDGVRVRVGSARYLAHHGIVPSPGLHRHDEDSGQDGHSLVYVTAGDEVIGAIELAPTMRPEIRSIIQALRSRGLAIYILSGDREAPTRRLAEALGADRYFAGTLPDQKAKLIAEWQAHGRSVCFVGDGINDAIALKTAHVSISLAGASTIAADTAQIVFMDPGLEKMLPLFQLADDLAENMRDNLLAMLVPSPIIMFGTWFLGFGYLSTSILVTVSSVVGLANAALAGRKPLRPVPLLAEPTETTPPQSTTDGAVCSAPSPSPSDDRGPGRDVPEAEPPRAGAQAERPGGCP